MATTYKITAHLHGGPFDGQVVTLPLPFAAFELTDIEGVKGERYELQGAQDGIWSYRAWPREL